jgi:membrane protease YdiL (CAAX protease family)
VTAPADYPGCPATVEAAIAEGRVLRAPTWGLWDVVIGMVGAIVIGLGAGAVFLFAGTPFVTAALLGTLLPWIALAGYPIVVARLKGNGARIDFGLRLSWSDTGWGVMGGLVALLLAGIAALVTAQFFPDVTSAAGEIAEELTDEGGRAALLLFAVMLMVGAPIVEELFFRGLMFSALRKRGVGSVLTIVISAVVFAGFHIEPLRFLVLLPSGLVLGWVRWRTGSTGAAMVTHGMVNAPGALALLVGVPDVSP